ncbi:hypothetical protein ACT4UL_05615, partial [Bacillus sp. HC-TM]
SEYLILIASFETALITFTFPFPKLISDEYVGNREKMKFKCDCGDEFITTFNQFRKGKRKCNKCGFKRCNQDKIFTYSEIKAFIDLESDSGCTLISNEYTNCKTPIKLKCRCGNEFVTTSDSFRHNKYPSDRVFIRLFNF